MQCIRCYINDAGNQISNLALSGSPLSPGPGPRFYAPDSYHADICMGREWQPTRVKNMRTPRPERLQVMRQYAWKRNNKLRRDLADFGVEFDTWFSETPVNGHAGSPEFMGKQGCTYREGGAVWFRASEFGVAGPRPGQAGRSYTYLMPDIAYHRNKLEGSRP